MWAVWTTPLSLKFPHVAVSTIFAKGFLLLLSMLMRVMLVASRGLVVLVVSFNSLLWPRVAAPFSHNLIQWRHCHSNGAVIATAFVKERKVISDA